LGLYLRVDGPSKARVAEGKGGSYGTFEGSLQKKQALFGGWDNNKYLAKS
jgi:hypothetical protein